MQDNMPQFKVLFMGALVAIVVPAASAQTIVCSSDVGKMFKSRQIEIVRSGKAVTVRPYSASGARAKDEWTYQVIAEEKSIAAFRAVRMSAGPLTMLDAVLGGELFVHREGGSLLALATGANAASGEVDGEKFTCR